MAKGNYFVSVMFFMVFVDIQSFVTVENGERAVLECPGFVPDPEHRNERHAKFYWYKAEKYHRHNGKQVAFYDQRNNLLTLEGDLAGRATIDGTSGALEIPKTKVTDEHTYSCYFQNAAQGSFDGEVRLSVSVTPAADDLKIFRNGPVGEGKSLTYICRALEVKPLPQNMYFQWSNSGIPLTEDFRMCRYDDGLTSYVSVELTISARALFDGKKLQCVFVTSTGGSVISSEETEVQALNELNWTIVLLGSFLSIFMSTTMILVVALICFYRRKNIRKIPSLTSHQSTTPETNIYYEIEMQQQRAAPLTDNGEPPHTYLQLVS